MAGCALTKTVSAKNISFERKPLSSGTPAIAAQATMASVPVIGMKRNRPSSRRMSRAALVVDDAHSHEERRLEGGVVHHVEHSRTAASGREPQQQRDQAQVADRRVGQQAFRSFWNIAT